MGEKTWDLDSGFCPYGHRLEVCHRTFWRDVDHPTRLARLSNKCLIRAREKAREQYEERMGRAVLERRPRLETPEKDSRHNPTGTTEDSGFTGTSGDRMLCKLILVCGCKIEAPRIGLNRDQEMHCDRHGFKLIHHVSAITEGERGNVWNPLAVVTTYVWPHVKNAGAGRA